MKTNLIKNIELKDNIIKSVIVLPNDIDIAIILQNKKFNEVNANLIVLVENKDIKLLNEQKIVEKLSNIHKKNNLNINFNEFTRNYFLNLYNDIKILYNIIFI